ncbi:hypothetical protein QUF99_16900 [Bacillus sp. DX4.1]|uniref:hypothetical protein n=1 Tax=Bacillus sp. DX4.1 TaxID=3055867 RepID=UPI0025A1397C|nr:hypothetical protein [Bacillus sp. DX4.1]MDM5188934.1 hypothetical protein [Bacillus sp. DX4.1]
MATFFSVLAFFTFIGGLGFGIIAAVRGLIKQDLKKAAKRAGIGLAIAVVSTIVGVSTVSNEEPKKEVKQEESTEAYSKKIEAAEKESVKKNEVKPAPEVKTVFAFGEEAAFDSGLTVKVTGVTTTTERNQFEPSTPLVAVVSAEVTNNTGGDLTLTSHDFSIIDGQGFQGTPYAQGDIGKKIAAGAKMKVQFHYAVENAAPFTVKGGVATWK